MHTYIYSYTLTCILYDMTRTIKFDMNQKYMLKHIIQNRVMLLFFNCDIFA